MKHLLRTAVIAAAVGFAILGGTATAFAADGPGSISLALTQPKVVNGSVSTTVNCVTRGTTYVVRAHRVRVDGTWIAAGVVIRSYAGPGTYSATVSMSFRRSHFADARALHNVQVTVGPTGGSFTFSRTATGAWLPMLAGKTFAGTISYVCS